MRALAGSVRFRTSLAATLVVAVLLALAAVALVRLQEAAINRSIDAALKLRADDIEALLDDGSITDTVPVTDDEVSAVQVFDSTGTLVAASANAATSPAMAGLPDGAGDRITAVARLPFEDDPFRVLARGGVGPDGRHAILVAGSPDDARESATALTGVLVAGVPLVVVAAGAGTWVLVGRALAPVEAIRREVAGIGAGGLERRVPEPGSRDEVARLARTMNEMLDRLEGAYDRQRAFVADAAHELRSPLASLRTQIEVNHPADHDLAEEVVRMQHLVDDLLWLAAAGASSGEPAAPVVDLDDIVLAEVRRAAPRDGVVLRTNRVSAAAVRADPERLERVVRNLLENALRHATREVQVDLLEADGRAVLSVADDGPGIPPGDRERVFERFTRLDAGRARDAGGAGLGLAITKAIVDAAGGRVWVDPGHAPGARFVVSLPST